MGDNNGIASIAPNTNSTHSRSDSWASDSSIVALSSDGAAASSSGTDHGGIASIAPNTNSTHSRSDSWASDSSIVALSSDTIPMSANMKSSSNDNAFSSRLNVTTTPNITMPPNTTTPSEMVVGLPAFSHTLLRSALVELLRLL